MNVLKILLIGKNGQLGWELCRTCATLGEVIAVDFPEIDLAQPETLRMLMREVRPDLVLNAAAYTNVDKAEMEPDLARKINAIAPGILAEEANRLDAVFVHYSTDYVFDGTKGSLYLESDSPNPINVYGITKYEGEQNVLAVNGANLVFRTSWVYSLRQGGFVNKVLRWARSQDTLKIVDDQISNPTWSRMLAEATSQVLAQRCGELIEYVQEKAGLYHLPGKGACSRYEWAKAILELDQNSAEHKVKEMIAAKSSDFPTAAERPLYTALTCNRFENAFNLSVPDWYKSLSLCFGDFHG
jgi:dTDP-4-dehydrorhamnose reductase